MLSQSIKTIKGIGGKKAEFFASLGVYSLLDLMCLYPFRYEDLSKASEISDLENEEEAVFLARVLSFESSRSHNGKNILRVNLSDDHSKIQAIFVNSPYMQKLLKKDELYWFHGKCSVYGKYKSVFHPEFLLYADKPEGMGVKPIYPLSKDLKQKDIRNSLEACKNLFDLIEENLPKNIINKYKLVKKSEAMYTMHFPNKMEDVERAKYRLKFEEIYLQQKEIFEKRRLEKEEKRKKFYADINSEEIYSIFDFELTESQKQTIKDIRTDLNSDSLMKRLIFGDVGSGKTVIAISAAYMAVKSSYQTCIMAPTEVLATQHYEEFKKHLSEHARICLLVASIKEKDKLIKDIAEGRYDIIIGTHALIQDNVVFKHLSVIITDEEHRFGVNQRISLKNKALDGADALSMSATPIPRTLSMIYYGNLDISYLVDMPKGRKKIITKFVDGNDNKKKLIKFIYDKIKEGEQAYFLAPRIEEDEEKNKSSVEKMVKYFREVYPDLTISYLYGKMSSDEKDKRMEAFKKGEISILISTTVIEVGINVPNASIILISGIEHFGLSQLHQLRGRVGRGEKQSYCFLTTNNKSPNLIKRARVMENYSSGFDIAEMDLKMRGPGEILGDKQHGFKLFKLVDYVEDYELIMKIHKIFLNNED